MSLTTPRSAKKSHHPLSLEELDSSDDSSDASALVNEITRLQKSIQQSKKEKRQWDLKIEGLEHDLVCAEKAREIGNNAALGVMKRLAVLFGEAMKEEDLVPKVRQLQERARIAKDEVETLKAQLASLRTSTPILAKSNGKRMQDIRDEIQSAKSEEMRLNGQLDKLDNEIETKKLELDRAQNEIEVLNRRFNSAVGGSNWTVTEIRERIAKNSDDYLLQHCARAAQAMGIPFDSRGQLSGFLDEVRERIMALKAGVAPSSDSADTFEVFSRQVDAAMAELDDVSREVKSLESERKDLQMKVDTRPAVIVEDYEAFAEEAKRQHESRTRKLKRALVKALALVGYEWQVPDDHSGICAMYRRLVKAINSEMMRLKVEKHQPADLTALESKVAVVRRQNRQLRKEMRKC